MEEGAQSSGSGDPRERTPGRHWGRRHRVGPLRRALREVMAAYNWKFDTRSLSQALHKRRSQIEAALPDILEAQGEFVKSAWQEGANGKMYPGMWRPFWS